jgi:hypothetical protein
MKTTQMIKTNNGMIRRNIYEVETATHLMKTVNIEDDQLHPCGLSHKDWPILGSGIFRMGEQGCYHHHRCPISVGGFLFNYKGGKNVSSKT